MNGELKPVAIAFASMVLPVPGGPRKSSPRSRLPPARSNASPDCQSETTRQTSSFASSWPRTSWMLTPLGIPRLERLDLREVHQQERAEEDDEVEDQEDRQQDEQRQHLQDHRHAHGLPDRNRRDREDSEHDSHAQPEAPEPGAAAVDDVLLPQLLALGGDQARTRDEAVEGEIEQAADLHEHARRRISRRDDADIRHPDRLPDRNGDVAHRAD